MRGGTVRPISGNWHTTLCLRAVCACPAAALDLQAIGRDRESKLQMAEYELRLAKVRVYVCVWGAIGRDVLGAKGAASCASRATITSLVRFNLKHDVYLQEDLAEMARRLAKQEQVSSWRDAAVKSARLGRTPVAPAHHVRVTAALARTVHTCAAACWPLQEGLGRAASAASTVGATALSATGSLALAPAGAVAGTAPAAGPMPTSAAAAAAVGASPAPSDLRVSGWGQSCEARGAVMLRKVHSAELNALCVVRTHVDYWPPAPM